MRKKNSKKKFNVENFIFKSFLMFENLQIFYFWQWIVVVKTRQVFIKSESSKPGTKINASELGGVATGQILGDVASEFMAKGY